MLFQKKNITLQGGEGNDYSKQLMSTVVNSQPWGRQKAGVENSKCILSSF